MELEIGVCTATASWMESWMPTMDWKEEASSDTVPQTGPGVFQAETPQARMFSGWLGK